MPKCFVIQPFDSDEFDKRYNDILKPIVEEMGLEAYRVDEDPTVTSIISAIEDGIQEAAVCLADISTNNPNVWLELGYARATDCSIVMICSRKHRDRLPFDIQDHAVIFYDSDSPRDFESLKSEIRRRIQATRKQSSRPMQSNENEGTSSSPSHQITKNQALLLAALADGLGETGGTVTAWSLRQSGKNYGLPGYDIEVEFRTLMMLGILEAYQVVDDYQSYEAIRITDYGIRCMKKNLDLFNAITDQKISAPPPVIHNLDDDIPF